MKKILCLCDYGQVRSVAMATVLREAGHFAVSGSYDNYMSTRMTHISDIIILFDDIIFMQENGSHSIDRDEWGDPNHPELLAKCREKAKEMKLI